MKTLPPTIYKDIPSIEEFKDIMKHKKVYNNASIKYNTVLSNYCIVRY